MASQKTKLIFTRPRWFTAAAARLHAGAEGEPAEAQAEHASAVPALIEAPALGTTAEQARRGSRILHIADFLPGNPAVDPERPARRMAALAQTRVQPIEGLLAAARDEDVDDDPDLCATTAMKDRPPALSGSGTRKVALGAALPRKKRRKLLVGAVLGMLAALVASALVALRSLGVDALPHGANTQVVDVPEPAADDHRAAPEPADAPSETAAGDGVTAPAGTRPELAPTRQAKRSRSRHEKRGEVGPTATHDPLERKAVDALASGDYARAIGSYEALARERADQHVYAEAARILRQRSERARKP